MGNNNSGQLGDGTTISRSNAVSVASNVTAMAGGYYDSLFLKGDRTLWAMGLNNHGQLGGETSFGKQSPIAGGSNVVTVTSGEFHSLFLKNDGILWALGYNCYGQLGDGTTVDRHNPTRVYGLSLSSVISQSSACHTLAVGEPLPPVISGQPVSQTVVAFSNVTFSVAADGLAPLTYQWLLNGAVIGGATATNCTLTGVSAAQTGDYAVVVSSPGGCVTSGVARLTVTKAWATVVLSGLNPTCDGLPQRATATTEPAGLWVVFTYDGLTNAPTAFGSYCVTGTVSDADWQGSASGTLVIAPNPPQITVPPVAQTAAAGSAVSFSVVASGIAPLTYAWTFNGSVLGGETATNLTLASATGADAGGYAVIVSNPGGCVTSGVAVLTVVNPAGEIGSGMNDSVRALAHDGTNLYAGGLFTEAGDGVAGYVAQWDGAGWTSLSNGVSGWVRALAYDGAYLYAGGYFTNASGVAVSHVARYEPTFIVDPGVAPDCGSATGGCRVVISGQNLCSGSDVTEVTICGARAAVLSQSATQIVVVAGMAASAGLGDVRVSSSSYGVTVKANAFNYLKADQTLLFPEIVGAVTAEDAVCLVASASSGLPVSFTVVSGPGAIAGGSNLTFSATGTVAVAASQAGNGVWNSAPGVTNTIGVGASVPWHAEVLTDESFGVRSNRFGFTVSGPANLRVVVETCTNLANPVWVPLETNTLTDGLFNFSDSAWTNYPARFYRLRQP